MFLSILIPTYNRSPFLIKNLEMLQLFISQLNGETFIEIIISNNSSTDDTHKVVSDFLAVNNRFSCMYFQQKENIGLKNNALFTLKMATGDYVMYLGDDDFIEYDYLKGVLEYLRLHNTTHVIIPNFYAVDIEGNKISEGRDDNFPNRTYTGGYKNCLQHSWRGHQLSGLVLRREGLYDAYSKYNIDNIYLFIFFVAYSCLNGQIYHFTEFPVQVTQPGQQNKDWGYGNDGLLNEVFDNYKKLPVSHFQKTILQTYFLKKQFWRLRMYRKSKFFKAFLSVWFSKNSTFLFKNIFPFEVIILIIYNKLNHIFSK